MSTSLYEYLTVLGQHNKLWYPFDEKLLSYTKSLTAHKIPWLFQVFQFSGNPVIIKKKSTGNMPYVLRVKTLLGIAGATSHEVSMGMTICSKMIGWWTAAYKWALWSYSWCTLSPATSEVTKDRCYVVKCPGTCNKWNQRVFVVAAIYVDLHSICRITEKCSKTIELAKSFADSKSKQFHVC